MKRVLTITSQLLIFAYYVLQFFNMGKSHRFTPYHDLQTETGKRAFLLFQHALDLTALLQLSIKLY